MSDHTHSCSCRLPWIVAVLALGGAVAALVVAVSSRPSTPAANDAPTVATTPAPTTDPRIATLQHDLSEVRRVLDDAQSALAQRDREIATANDDLRLLRQEMDALRAKQAAPAP